VAVLGVSLGIPLVTYATLSPSSGVDGQAPVALTGIVQGVEQLAPDSVYVQISPDQDILESLDGEAVIVNSEVPASMIETSGNSYTVRIDPTLLPPDVVSSTGIVSFEVFAQDPERGRFGLAEVSVRVVQNEDGGYSWTDPLGPVTEVEAPETVATRAGVGFALTSSRAKVLRSVRLVLPRPSARGVICGEGGCASTDAAKATRRVPIAAGSLSSEPEDDGEVDGDAPIEAPIISEGETAAAGECNIDGDGMWWTNTKRNVSTTIGTGYPVGADTSKMSHSSGSSAEFTGSFGVAWDNIGIFTQSGTRAVERGSGFDWDSKSYARSYRVGLVYQKVKAMYDKPCDATPYYVKWVPIGYSGGFGENTDGVTRPDWNTCVRIGSTGTWWRDSSSGSSYSLSTGVKFAGVIGVDLSSKRAYNAEARLGYYIGVEGRRVCANTNPPGMASKVMERRAP
jgi:hypothetical protein